jgi:hypothetical protein
MSTHGPHHQFWKSKSLTITVCQLTFVNFAANKHLSTTAGSLNHDTKSLPFSQKAAIITYLSQLNPINTHKPRPFTIRCSSLLPPQLRLPLPKRTIPLLFQLKLFVRINPPPPSNGFYTFYPANDPNICYTQTFSLSMWHFASLITYIIFSTLV